MTKWTRLILLSLLIPNLICAASPYYLAEYNKDIGKISAEWKRHNELFEQFSRLNLEKKGQNITLLRESITCCERAITHCDHILKKIGEKSHEARKEWKREKEQAEQDKNNLNTEIANLKGLIDATLKEIAFSKAVPLYQESEKKANLAILKNNDRPRHLNNAEEVVSTLNEVSNLYEEALSLARSALNLISPYSDEESKNTLRKAIDYYETTANKYKKEAIDWPFSVTAQKNTLKIQVATLKADSQLFIEKGLKRSSYELQKQALLILEQLVESSSNEEAEILKEEISQLKTAIAAFEKEAESCRLTKLPDLLSSEDFTAREKERRELFFKSDLVLNPDLFVQNILHPKSHPFALPLDGCVAKKGEHFTLYIEQFYRFLIQSEAPVSELVVTVYKKDELVYEEIVTLPLKNTLSWERYLVVDGMTFIPETKLKTDFGLDLRLNFFCDPRCNFSMTIAQKCNLPDYQFSFSIKDIPSVTENLDLGPSQSPGAGQSQLVLCQHQNLVLGGAKATGLHDRKTSCIELIQRDLRSCNRESFRTSPTLNFDVDRALARISNTGDVEIVPAAGAFASVQNQVFSHARYKTALYVCDFLQPPPWQLESLRKPVFEGIDRPTDKQNFSLTPLLKNELGKQLERSFPILDQFVDQMKRDPLSLAAYVYNEIELDNRLSYQQEGVFHAIGIQKNACMTFLEKRGSPWEQCQLLVYLLRKAGYQSLYVTGTTCSLPKTFLEKMLLKKLPLNQTEGLVNYPWVIFFEGKEWISLFPWMKEMQVHEGHDLYNLMPEGHASADRWILRYLKEDEKILRHIGSDKDDTLGGPFYQFCQGGAEKAGIIPLRCGHPSNTS